MPNLSSWSLTQNDYDGEKTISSFIIPDLTVTNIPVLLPYVGALQSAIEGVTMGVPVQSNLTFENKLLAAPGVKASDKNAQRERKWLIKYYDSVTFRQFRVELGCADAALLPATNTDTVNLQVGAVPPGAWAAFVTAFEQLVDTPDGNDAKLLEAVLVGRNT